MPAEAISESVAGVDIIFRGFSAKRLTVVRPAIMRDVRLLPLWCKALTVGFVRSKKCGACVNCVPENHLATIGLGAKWFDLTIDHRRVYIIHEIIHMHHWSEAEFVELHLPAVWRDEYLRRHEGSTDTMAYAMRDASGGMPQ